MQVLICYLFNIACSGSGRPYLKNKTEYLGITAKKKLNMGQCATREQHKPQQGSDESMWLPLGCGPRSEDDADVPTDFSGRCVQGRLVHLSAQVPNFYVGRWSESANMICLTIGADGEFVYQFGTISTRKVVRGWREPPHVSRLVWSIFGSAGEYKLERVSEDAIYLDGVIPLFRDKQWEEELLNRSQKPQRSPKSPKSPNPSIPSWMQGRSGNSDRPAAKQKQAISLYNDISAKEPSMPGNIRFPNLDDDQ